MTSAAAVNPPTRQPAPLAPGQYIVTFLVDTRDPNAVRMSNPPNLSGLGDNIAWQFTFQNRLGGEQLRQYLNTQAIQHQILSIASVGNGAIGTTNAPMQGQPGSTEPEPADTPATSRRTMSAAARRKISQAQKARQAKLHKQPVAATA